MFLIRSMKIATRGSNEFFSRRTFLEISLAKACNVITKTVCDRQPFLSMGLAESKNQ